MTPERITPGRITRAVDVNVWPHEMETARALAAAGFDVEFLRRDMRHRARSADLRMDGAIWEMKAPTSHHLKMVQQNLRRALHQAPNIVFDSRRMKRLPGEAIEREVRTWVAKLPEIKRLIFIDRHSRVTIIK